MSKLYWSNKKTGTMAVNIPKSIYMAMGWRPGDMIIIDILGQDKIKITRREVKFNPELWDTRKPKVTVGQ